MLKSELKKLKIYLEKLEKQLQGNRDCENIRPVKTTVDFLLNPPKVGQTFVEDEGWDSFRKQVLRVNPNGTVLIDDLSLKKTDRFSRNRYSSNMMQHQKFEIVKELRYTKKEIDNIK
jgi:hypothetical protein